MQLYVLHPCPLMAAERLTEVCPVRARKQLLETNQMLATLSRDWRCVSPMLKKDGKAYGTKMHEHHPVTKWTDSDDDNLLWVLWFNFHLSQQFPSHAAGLSFNRWLFDNDIILDYCPVPRVDHAYYGTPGVLTEEEMCDDVYQNYFNYIRRKQGRTLVLL